MLTAPGSRSRGGLEWVRTCPERRLKNGAYKRRKTAGPGGFPALISSWGVLIQDYPPIRLTVEAVPKNRRFDGGTAFIRKRINGFPQVHGGPYASLSIVRISKAGKHGVRGMYAFRPSASPVKNPQNVREAGSVTVPAIQFRLTPDKVFAQRSLSCR